MRQLMMILEQDLNESVEIVGDPPYRVFRDPQPNTLLKLAKSSRKKILKGLYDPNSANVYVWDAYLATHGRAEYDLGINHDDAVGLIIGMNEDGQIALHICDFGAEEIVKCHPSFRLIKADIDQALHRRWN